MSSGGLATAAEDRKARLAALKSLKRKQPDTDQDELPAPIPPQTEDQPTTTTPSYLSGRNYDAETRGPKFGFESNPAENQETLEKKAAALAEETRLQAEKDAEEDRPLDLFKLQPKKPNWDLKRDLGRKLDVLNVRTENAIAKLVRERIAAQQANKEPAKNGDGENVDVGMEGAMFVEATREREREDEEDARREKDMDEQLLDAS